MTHTVTRAVSLGLGALLLGALFTISPVSLRADEAAPPEAPPEAPVEEVVEPEAPLDPVLEEPEVVVEEAVIEEAPSEEPAPEEPAPAEVLGAEAETEAATESAPTSAPELSTDKDDYHPGEIATIFGKFFASMQDVVVKIFGSDEEGNNYTEKIETVTTDENGSFAVTYQLDPLYRPFYEVFVHNLAGEQLAATWFRDSSVGLYDQCSNDLGTGYTTGDTGCRWIFGNLNGNNSSYLEGDATVQRLWLEGFVPGSSHTVTFKYGTTKAGHHAYDYLTNWNHSENWVTPADRCQDITGCTTASETTLAMQDDPNITNTIEPSGASRLFTMRGGTITAVSVPTIISGTYAGDSETGVTVTFTVGPANGSMCSTKKVQGQDVTSCGIALWFGAHIAKTIEWNAFNGTTGAGSISGSPYHVALAAIDADAGQGGGRDNQMAASAIPASIIIRKDTVSDAAQDFSFTTTGTGLSNFTLDDDGETTNLSNIRIFTGLNSGSYTVTETAQAGYAVTISCTDPTTNTTVNNATRQASIALATGETVECTFTNTLQQASLTLLKNVVNDNGGTALDTAWTLSANGPTPISGVEGNAAVTNAAVNAGVYTLSESGGPQGYSASQYSCVKNGGGAVVSNSITLAAGDNATCTITNDDIGPTLTIVKTVVNDNGGTAVANDFQGKIDGGNVPWDVAQAVNVGVHTASETTVAGYTAGSWGGDCATNGTVTLALGENKTCTITNDDQPGQIKIVKNTVGGDATFDFTVGGPSGSAKQVSTSGGTGDTGFFNVNAGSYSVSETVPSGWTLTGSSCTSGTPGNFSVPNGGSVTCTFTNTKKGSITIEKQTLPDGNTTDFSFTGDVAGTLSDGESATVEVIPGTYTSTEGALAGWDLTGISCDDNDSTGNLGNKTATFNVAAGENVKCTFLNTKRGSLTIVKNTVGGNGTFNFTLGGIAPSALSLATAGGTNSATYNNLVPGAFSASETVPGGWELTSATCDLGETPESIDIEAGEHVTCTFVNTKNPTLTLVKNVVNDNGGTAIANNFQGKIDGNNVPWSAAQIVSIGAHTASETNLPGYTASAWGGDCAADGSITLAAGENKTCTITNDDDAPSLTLVKQVVNDNGGTAVAGDWTLIADGYDTDSPDAGTYDLSETGGPLGYTQTSLTCDNAVGQVTSVTLGLGEDVTCTFVNDDIAPTLKLVKTVTKDNGGTAVANDWDLTATGVGGFTELTPDAGSASAQTVKAGVAYALSESGPSGYAASAWSCTGGTQNGASITLALDEDVTCTINNDDIQPKLKLVKTVNNQYGGTATADSFQGSVSGTDVDWDVFAGFDAGNYNADETGLYGYTAGDWGGDCAADGSVTLAVGDEKTCTIVNSDVQPKLTLIKNIVNDSGGDAEVGDFPLFVDATEVVSGEENGFNAGSYTASETNLPGYTAGDWGGDCAADGSVTLAVGDDKTCEITNDDQQAYITVVKVVDNNYGGTAEEDDFDLTLDGSGVLSGVAVPVDPGTYSVGETELPGYAFSGYSGDCSATIDAEDRIDQIADWNTKIDALLGAIEADPNDDDSGRIDQIADAQAKIDALESSLEASITVALGESKTCTITNEDTPARIIVDKTVVNDDGGSAVPNDFSLLLDQDGVLDGVLNVVNAGVYTASETNLPGYAAGTWGEDCSENGSVSVAIGDIKVCAITNDDIAPTLKLVKQVTNNNGGTAVASDWDLSATGDAGFTDAGDSDTFHTVKADTAYDLSEDGPTGYTAGAWSCDGGSLEGSLLTLALDEDVTCTIVNDDIAPKLHLRKVVVNDNDGTATLADFTLSANGTGANDLSGTSPVDSGAGLVADTWALSEVAGVSGYTASNWSCVGGTQNGASITVGIGEEATCTITNDDQPGHLIVHKVTVPAGNETNFSITASGGTIVSPAATQPIQDGGSVDYTVNKGTYSVSEEAVTGWDMTGNTCTNVSVGSGETKECTITNTKRAKLTIVKDAQPNDLIDFSFNGGVLGSFLLDDDQGVAGVGLNGDVNQPNSKTFENVVPGAHTITETQPNQYWKLKSATCVETGTQTAYAGTLTGNVLSLTLAAGKDVTCTFVNEKISPTRTLGFWQTHKDYTSAQFASKGPFFIGQNVLVGAGTHKGILTSVSQVFGAFYASIPKTTTNTNRSALDKARVQLLQQLMAAKLNCQTFTCASSVQTMITNADAAFAGTNVATITSYISQLDAYNNSGDTIIIGNAGKADPKGAKAIADLVFWNTP